MRPEGNAPEAGKPPASGEFTDEQQAREALAAEREFLKHTIELQDQQRQLIAYEIHDGLIQYTIGALMQLESLRSDVQPPASMERVDAVITMLRKAVDEGRRIINGIRSPLLDASGVVPAIEQMIAETDLGTMEVELIKDDAPGRMAPNIEEALFRITQEALTNALRHSQSKKMRIELAKRGDRVQLKLEDKGIGFNTRQASPGVHGLKGIQERARIAGGHCSIQSTLGKGTRVNVDLPYVPRET